MRLNKVYNHLVIALVTALILVSSVSCKRDFEELELATFPKIAEVFIDGFSPGLDYAAFGNSKLSAFEIDTDIAYKGTASIRIAVPDADDPEGGYAGGVFFTQGGRDLSGFDALSFWARASKAATIDLVGFGNDLDESKYTASITDLTVNTNWKKFIIPIPDPSRLTEERGMLYYSEGPEDERGYTFWIDEVKFEKLGTLSDPLAGIQNGQEETVSAETGSKIPIRGLFARFTLPSGTVQSVEAAPGYFTFASSETSVATVGNSGIVSVLDEGVAVITAKLMERDAIGSLTIESSGQPVLPLAPAPSPTISADSVISMFSNAYTNVPIDTWNTGWQFSTAQTDDIQINGEDVKRYRELNFVGIEFVTQKIDATDMTHFHMDIWTPDPTDLPAAFKVLLVDFGMDGSFAGGDDSSHELSFTSPILATESWVSLDVPLSDFAGLVNRANLAQMVLSGDLPNVFIDNVYFYKSGSSEEVEPAEAAPTPTQNPSNVVSLFSNAYANVPVDTWSADWDQAELADVQVAGDDVKLYTGLAFAGIEFTSQTVDASRMDRFHMDIWTPDPTAAPAVFKIKLVDFGADGAFGNGDDVEHELTLDANSTPALATESWVGIDLPLSDFAGLITTGHLAQMIISGDPNTLYVDNVYFYNSIGVATEPSQAAPSPMQDEADVVSLFSDAYTDVSVDTWRTDWSSVTLEDVTVEGNAVKKYSNLDFAGIETVANTVDATNMTHLHIDVWSADYTFFGIKLVDFGADGAFGGGDDVEHQINFDTPVQGDWLGFDIALSDFTGLVTRGNIAQYILVGQPAGTTTIYVDNLYFYGEGSGMATEPSQAAPSPMQDEADVISLFSDAYTDVSVDTWRTDWSSVTLEDVTVEGNAVKKYSDLDFAGIETVANTVDATNMTHLHIDVWSADYTFFGIKLVDFGADGAFGGGDDVEHQINFDTPMQGDWLGFDIALSDFTGLVTRGNIAQYILVGQPAGATTIYIDNVYFYK